jgi:hypothetical protein
VGQGGHADCLTAGPARDARFFVDRPPAVREDVLATWPAPASQPFLHGKRIMVSSLMMLVLFAVQTILFVIGRRAEKARGDPDGKAQMYLVGIVVGVLGFGIAAFLVLAELGGGTRPPSQ